MPSVVRPQNVLIESLLLLHAYSIGPGDFYSFSYKIIVAWESTVKNLVVPQRGNAQVWSLVGQAEKHDAVVQ